MMGAREAGMRIVTVFGGSGFIGRATCQALAAAGCTVLATDLRPAAGLPYRYLSGDIADEAFVAGLCAAGPIEAVAFSRIGLPPTR